MKIATLSAKHPTYDADTWRRHDALYRGGEAFRARIQDFLPRNPQEPTEVYDARQAEAHFTGYAGPICDWFAAKLCSASMVVRSDGAADDSFYAEWKEDVDGAGTDLIDFIRTRFTAALVKGRSWWRVELPDDEAPAPANRAQWEQRGLGNALLVDIDNEQVLDFETDARGALLWAIVHSYETPRENPRADRATVRERWQIIDREQIETWGADYLLSDPRPEDAKLIGVKPHGFSRVPLVRLGFVGTRGVKVKSSGKRLLSLDSGSLEGFWLMRRLADPQVAHFRNSAALDWSIKRTCYAMPVFYFADEERPPTMGTGYYIKMGVGEKAEWIAPPTAHLTVLAERCEHLQQEVYRVANQMAQGVNNNAAAIGRSGESKQADAQSTEVVLRVYGALCREAIEATYDLVSEGRGEQTTWSIEGFDVFSVGDAQGAIAAIQSVEQLSIPSPTLRRELYYKAGDVLLPNADQPTKDAIRDEINAGVDAQVDLTEAEDAAKEGDEPEDAAEDDDAEPASSPMPSVKPPRKAVARKPPARPRGRLIGKRAA